MTVKKDPKRQLLGKIAKARGKQFESRIDDSFAYYAQKGFAIIEKTPEPMHPTKNLGNGKFIAYYEKQAQPDYKGTIKGGRTVMFEAKFTACLLYTSSPNDFLTKLFAEYNAKATAEVEQNAVDQAAYEAAMVEGTAIIASIVDADTANAAMPKYQALKHALTSNKELGVLWNKKIKECGLFFDKVLKKYTPAPEEAKEAE